MKVGAQLTEDDIVDFIVLAAVNEFRNQRTNPTDSKTIWTKVAFYLIRHLDLPVTTYWYRYGGFVDTDRLNLDRIQQVYGSLATDAYPDPNATVLLSVRYHDFFKSISDEVLDHWDMFFTPTNSLRRAAYIEDAPPRLKEVYLANLDLLESCDTIWRLVDDKVIPVRPAQEAGPRISELHLSIARLGYPWAHLQPAIRFTELIELMLIKLGAHRPLRDEWTALWSERFKDLLKEYQETAWFVLSSHFAAETAEGPRKQAIIESMKRKTEEVAPSAERAVERVASSLFSEGLLPTAAEIDAAIRAKRSGNRAKEYDLLTAHFAEFTKGGD